MWITISGAIWSTTLGAGPGSRSGGHLDALERPYDVKFGPDGALYILDMGEVQVNDGKISPAARTGKILRLDVGK